MGDQYVQRLMQGKCTCGSMENYLNLPLDHGVRFGPDEQPLLNANDHVPAQHVIHFGKCSSPANPANYKGPIFIPSKCQPMTFLPWINGNEENLIEGAPALTTKSKLPCFFGGVISIVEEKAESSAPQEQPKEEPEQKQEEPKPEEPLVQAKSISQFSSIKR